MTMRIGILTDIHEEVEHLARALDHLGRAEVDTIVSLGDACDLYGGVSRAPEVARLLQGAGVIGVWGNHDCGLCRDVAPRVQEQADPALLAYMATMQPRLVIEDCHFTHVEPWLDPDKPEDLWYFEGPPDTLEKAQRSFAAVQEKICFLGHFHRWLAMSDAGPVPWQGTTPLVLAPDRRYLVVIAPLMDGAYALLDTQARTLYPYTTHSQTDPVADTP